MSEKENNTAKVLGQILVNLALKVEALEKRITTLEEQNNE